MEYKITSSEIVHVGRFDVVCEKVLHDGTEYPFSYVKTKDCAAAICIVDNDIIILKQYRHTLDSWEWEIPAGSVELGYNPESTIKKEIEEETGYRVKKIEYMGWYHLSVGSSTERVFLYFADCVECKEQRLEPLELIEVHRIKQSEFERMVKNNIIHQCMGITAWTKYKMFVCNE